MPSYFKDTNTTVAKLKKICHEEKITGYSNLKKKDLINKITVVRLERLVQSGMKELSKC